MAAEVYHKHGQFLADLSALSGGVHDDTERVKYHVEARSAELRSLREAADQRSRFLATQVIEEAVREVLGEPLVLEAKVEWRRGSGAAHGLPWSLLGRPSTRQTGEADLRGVAAFVAAGGWQSVSNGYLAAYHLLRHGWLLLDRRGSTGRTNEQGSA